MTPSRCSLDWGCCWVRRHLRRSRRTIPTSRARRPSWRGEELTVARRFEPGARIRLA